MREETPLLMIHGWMGSSYSYRPLLARLSGRRRAIALDLPGFGLSRKAGIEYNLEFFMSFLNRYLQVMRLQRVVLVGHSFGGELAVHFALRHPEKVEKLILIAPYGLEGEEGGLRLLRRSGFLVDLFSSLNSRAALEWGMRQNTFHDPALITPDQVDSVAATALTPEGRKAQAAIAKNVLGRYPVDDLLARLKAPVLLIWGEEDRLLELEWGKKYFSLLPPQSAAGLYTVPAAGHLPQVEAPDRTAELILRFLAEARAGAPPGRP
jgi:pimeloyl-ACP methyl ester carboxylesterase